MTGPDATRDGPAGAATAPTNSTYPESEADPAGDRPRGGVGAVPEPMDAAAPIAGDADDERMRQTRRDKANRATRGVLAAVLCLEALVMLLVPRAIAQTATGLDTWKTVILLALALVLFLTGFMLRRPWGIGFGSVLQLAVLATGVLIAAMFAVAVIFIAIWLWVLTMRRDLVGTPGGVRLLIS